MKFQFGFRGFRWSYVDVPVTELSYGFPEFKGAALFVD